MKFDGASGIGGAKSAGFDYSTSLKGNDDDDLKKSKFDNFPGGIFTMPSNNIAFQFGGQSGPKTEVGGFNA